MVTVDEYVEGAKMYAHLARLAEEIGREMHDEAIDPQEDASDIAGERIAKAIRAAEPKWTTTPPTEGSEGFYWVDGVYRSRPHVLYCVAGGWWDERIQSYEPYADGLRFIGPLPVPEPPTE
jgi:hypothetical protein